MEVQVLITGAGPTGLVLAILLKKHGVNFRIIDKKSEPTTASKAIAIHARTLEFYRQIGIVDLFLNSGIKVEKIRLHRKEKMVAELNIGNFKDDISPYPFILNLPQAEHEAILRKELSRLGVNIEWGTELIKVETFPNEVHADLKSAKGIETCHVKYLCGCDGAHSYSRHQLDIDFPGGSYSQTFYVADISPSKSNVDENINLYLDEANFCVSMPIRKNGDSRLTGIVPEHLSEKEVDFEDIKLSVEKISHISINALNWFSTYKVHHRVADKFHKNRIFLLGDAAHIHSPTGGQGMNTGIGDAVNLAWKLAAVIHEQMDKKILDSYEVERIDFARKLVKTTDRLFQCMVNKSFFGKAWRYWLFPYLFRFVGRIEKLRMKAFKTIGQLHINYRHSPYSKGKVGIIRAGDRLPWVRYEHTDNFEPLKEMKWQLHIYGNAYGHIDMATNLRGLSLHIFSWNESTLKAGLTQNALYLIRPDGYIALIDLNQDLENLNQYLDNFK